MLFAQQPNNAIDRISLADAARIKLHRGSINERDGAGGCIEVNIAPPGLLFQSKEFGFRRDASMIVEEPPCAHERAHRHIKRAVTPAAPGECRLQKREGLRIGGHRMRAGFAAYARELARWPIVAEQRLDAVNLLEGELHPL